jgi:CsoR family transcriptional regulator, copper-sensing transcriptional repressor
MTNADAKKAVGVRLRRIDGHVQAVGWMVPADRYCVDLMHQLAAVHVALRRTAEVVLRSPV